MLALVENHDDALHRWPTDAVLVLEAATIAADVNQLVKFGVGRERPFVHALPESEKGAVAHPSDNNLSFYSGHTNWVFALAASSGTVATLRGYRWAPWVWGGGLTVAFTTGYLRIAADRHYFTDVIVGAALGSAFGFAIPYLFHSPRRDPTAPTFGFVPTQGGGMLVAQWLQ
jgi:membrane-associated phospholipid phosphatase